MLFISSFHLLEIQPVIAWLACAPWLILLFQIVIFFAENSLHYKQDKKGARMGAFLFGPG
jgi:hypothetical protein